MQLPMLPHFRKSNGGRLHGHQSVSPEPMIMIMGTSLWLTSLEADICHQNPVIELLLYYYPSCGLQLSYFILKKACKTEQFLQPEECSLLEDVLLPVSFVASQQPLILKVGLVSETSFVLQIVAVQRPKLILIRFILSSCNAYKS